MMNTYDICIIVLTLIAIVTLGNIIVAIVRGGRKQEKVVKEVAATQYAAPVEPVVISPIEDNSEADDDEYVISEQPVDEQSKINDSEYVIAAIESGNVEETDSGVTVYNADGTVFYFGYNKSFKAKLIQAKDEVKEYYNLLKNYVLKFNKVKTNISWHQESVRFGKEKVCWFVLRGKSLYLYLPLNPDDYADTKYKVERAKAKRFEELPCMYKITNNRRLKYAFELIYTVMMHFETTFIEKDDKDYVVDYPYESTADLIKNKLIKVTKSNRKFLGK